MAIYSLRRSKYKRSSHNKKILTGEIHSITEQTISTNSIKGKRPMLRCDTQKPEGMQKLEETTPSPNFLWWHLQSFVCLSRHEIYSKHK